MRIGLQWIGHRPHLRFTQGRQSWVGIRVALASWLMKGMARERDMLATDLEAVRRRVNVLWQEREDRRA